jgi:ABC-2 type transport system ATP-binding protein
MLQGGGGIDPRMTAREVVTLHARFHADPRNVDELLDEVGLAGPTAGTRYRRLSGGEKQRVGLALALVGRPEVAILDEPTAGMDVEARATTRDLLAGLRASGVTIVLTSHDLADVERLADRIAILDRGRIVALGAPQELIAAASSVLRFRLSAPLSEPDRLALAEGLAALPGEAGRGEAGRGGVAVQNDPGPGWYRVDGLAPTPSAVALLASWCEARGALIVELRTGGGSLEERYLELIGGTGDAELGEDEVEAPAGPAGRRRRRAR